VAITVLLAGDDPLLRDGHAMSRPVGAVAFRALKSRDGGLQ
jgi:hypothetical protein